MKGFEVVVVVHVVAAVLTGIVAWRAVRQKGVPGARSFGVGMGAVSLWAVLTALSGVPQVSSSSVLLTAVWRLEYVPIGVLTVAWLTFCLGYTGRASLVTRRRVLLLSIVPAITAIAALCHPFFIPSYAELLGPFGGAVDLLWAIEAYWQEVFWLGVAYTYMLLFVGSVFLFEVLVERPLPHLGQALVLLIVVPPWILNVVHLTDLLQFSEFDPTILGFTISGIAGLVAIGRFRLFDVPMARARIVEDLDSGVLVYGRNGRVYDYNERAASMLDIGPDALETNVGKVLADSPLDLPSDIVLSTDHSHERGSADGMPAGVPEGVPEPGEDGREPIVDGGVATVGNQLDGRTLPVDGEGNLSYVETRISPLAETGGRRRSRVIHLYDVTDRERNRREIERSHERYRTLFENNQLVLWEFDLSLAKERVDALAGESDDLAAYLATHPEQRARVFEGLRVTDVNEKAVDVYEAESSAQIKEHMEELLTEQAVETWCEIFAAIAAGETSIRKECVTRTFEGDRRVLLTELNVPDARTDTYDRVYVTALDITNRKERELQLERYERLVENLPVGVFRTTPEGEFVDVNEKYAELMADGSREDILAADPREVYVDPEDREWILETLRTDGSFTDREVEVRSLDGDQFWVSTTMTLQEEDGQTYIEGVSQDVTERKQRQRKLERKNEFLDEFASVVSHDVATPLNVIENKAQLVELTGDTSHAEDIYDAVGQIQQLIDELRDLAREGKQVGETEPVELETVAREAWRTVETPRATFSIEDSGTVEADRERLRQLLTNLFGNAAEHGVPDGETVTVEVGRLTDGFYVADDGAGIPAADRDRIFEQGFTTDEESTGLGLAIVARIAEGHGWQVDLTESYAGGARFEFRTST